MNSEITGNEVRRPVKTPKEGKVKSLQAPNLAALDHHGLTRQASHLYRNIAWMCGLYAFFGSLYVIYSNFTYSLPFFMITGTGTACMFFWNNHGKLGLPAFPVLVLQLTFVNSISLITGNSMLNDTSASVIWISAGTVAFFLIMLLVGWWLGVRILRSKPSAWNILRAGDTSAEQIGLHASIPLLLFSIIFQASIISGFIYQFLPGDSVTFLPVFQAFAGSANSLGAFLGGIAVAKNSFRPVALWFWLLFVISFLLFTSSVLLSSAVGLVFSCAIGMGFGTRRIPWAFLIVTSLVVGFLNQGKFEMRKEYWDPETGSANIQLSTIPKLYAEWIKTSLSMFQENLLGDTPVVPLDDEEAGQGFITRLGDFQNLTFIVNVLEEGSIEPLYGKTYALIPNLLIPRFLWHEKPRTHAGQIMLNLNFGRQDSEEATYTTYVAWGLLPEAVGNFGTWPGACFLGLLAGLGCGLLEAWSARKRIFSVEGLICIAMLVEIAASYELVASVLIPSIFQLLIAVITFGVLLRLWFWKGESTPQIRPPLRRRPVDLKGRYPSP